ncbi:type I toxin-antitoxin system Fst family toxin [Aeribacillus sp. FSL K6-2848]
MCTITKILVGVVIGIIVALFEYWLNNKK